MFKVKYEPDGINFREVYKKHILFDLEKKVPIEVDLEEVVKYVFD